ncbi:MAG: sulfotransferase [Planctomycetota bacterium]
MPNPQNIESPTLIIGSGRTSSSYVISHLQHTAGVSQELIENYVCRDLYRALAEAPWCEDWHYVSEDQAEVRARIRKTVHDALITLFPSDLPSWTMKMLWAGQDPGRTDWLFPDARYLHLVRDPRTCVPSIMERIGHSKRKACTEYRYANQNAFEFRRFGERYLMVRQEDFLTDRVNTWRRIHAHLGIEFDSSADWTTPINVAESQIGRTERGRRDSAMRWGSLPKPIRRLARDLGYDE